MKRIRLCMSGLFLLMMTAAASHATAQVVAPGPYYAIPSWAQKIQCDTRATCPRFIVLSNWNDEAVLDRETGLVWQRSPSVEPETWRSARLRCLNLAVADRKSWRLPTYNELASLVDAAVPGLPPGHPFNNVQPAIYFSSTASREFDFSPALTVLGVSFGDASHGIVSIQDEAAFLLHYWCVRGPLSTQVE